MAFINAYNFMMDNEDMGRQYKTAPDAPPGAYAISGINSVAYPTQFETINAIPQSQRGSAVEKFYETYFWNKWFNELTNVPLSMRVFDSAVNMGPGTAVILLQKAVNSIAPDSLIVDGHWGPNTVATVNKFVNLLAAFQSTRAQYYRDIVAKNPSDEKYLSQWLSRAEK